MKLSVLMGGRAGQGINKISQIISEVLKKHGYFTFNYRDYQSLIRGGHNFNVLVISDKKISSSESKINYILAMDELTTNLHKKELTKNGRVIDFKQFEKLNKNINIALAGAFIKILGIEKKCLIDEIKKEFNNKDSLIAAEKGYNSQKEELKLKKLKNKINIISGSQAVAQGAINSELDLYIAYPMTPATGVLHELASRKAKHKVFQPENEIAVVNANAALNAVKMHIK